MVDCGATQFLIGYLVSKVPNLKILALEVLDNISRNKACVQSLLEQGIQPAIFKCLQSSASSDIFVHGIFI
jgi:hypothetical protein